MDLAAAVDAGLRALDDLSGPAPWYAADQLARTLSEAGAPLAPTSHATVATAAVRVAVAHLRAGNPRDAHLALRAAHENLPRRRPDLAGPAGATRRDPDRWRTTDGDDPQPGPAGAG